MKLECLFEFYNFQYNKYLPIKQLIIFTWLFFKNLSSELLKNCVFVYVYIHMMCAGACRGQKGVWSPQIVRTGSCEPLDVGLGTELCKCSWLLSHFSSPWRDFLSLFICCCCFFFLNRVYLCVIEVKAQLSEVGSLLTPCGFSGKELNLSFLAAGAFIC